MRFIGVSEPRIIKNESNIEGLEKLNFVMHQLIKKRSELTMMNGEDRNKIDDKKMGRG